LTASTDEELELLKAQLVDIKKLLSKILRELGNDDNAYSSPDS